MVQITATDGIAIAILALYAITLVISLVVAFRHGLSRNSGWIFLCIFSAIRIVYAGAVLSTISNPTETALTIAEITQFLGLSPLLLASLGLISRLYYEILPKPWNIIFTLGVLKAVQTPTVIALILCIVGATDASDPQQITQETTVQAGVIVFLVVILVLILLVIGAYVGYKKTHRGERPLLTALSLSLPFLLVRIIYSLLICFDNSGPFAAGSEETSAIVARTIMETAVEMLVTLFYLWAGMTVRQIAPEDRAARRVWERVIDAAMRKF